MINLPRDSFRRGSAEEERWLERFLRDFATK